MKEEYFGAEQSEYIAQLIDEEMTIFERMKVKKSTLIKILAALVFYALAMVFFSLVL